MKEEKKSAWSNMEEWGGESWFKPCHAKPVTTAKGVENVNTNNTSHTIKTDINSRYGASDCNCPND